MRNFKIIRKIRRLVNKLKQLFKNSILLGNLAELPKFFKSLLTINQDMSIIIDIIKKYMVIMGSSASSER